MIFNSLMLYYTPGMNRRLITMTVIQFRVFGLPKFEYHIAGVYYRRSLTLALLY
jgi:hypothetical protein